MEDVVRPLTLQENPVKVSEVLPVTRLAAEAYLEQFHSVDDLHKAAQDLAMVALEQAGARAPRTSPFFTNILSRLSLKELMGR